MKNKKYITTDEITYKILVSKINQLENKIDKAIEYIKKHDLFDRKYDDKKAKNDLLNILKGENNDK